MKIKKRDLILESIIKAYLDDNSPIGSNELGLRMQSQIPASTIRVYFKKLSDEGAITQLHISGGRIPTIATMNLYWQNRLNFDTKFRVDDAEIFGFLVKEFGFYCMIFGGKNLILDEVLNVENKFLILDFASESIVLKFNPKVERFLRNLLKISLDELEQISIQVGLSELRVRIRELKRSGIYFQENQRLIYEIFDDERANIALDPSFSHYLSSNLTFKPIFQNGYMGLKTDILFEGKSAVMICAGSVYSDYEKFLNHLREAA